VILVGEHGDEGAMGVVLNRPSAIPVEEAVPPLVELPGLGDGDGLVYVGGPVQPDAIVVLADFDDPAQAGVLILGSVGFLPGDLEPATFPVLHRSRVFAGYAGWGPGQLEDELLESSWIVEETLAGEKIGTDFLDLSRLQSDYARRIYSCKACVSTAQPLCVRTRSSTVEDTH